MHIKVGSLVSVEHGVGEVVGIDLPEAREHLRRWIVRVDEPKPAAVETIAWLNRRACYFPREVTLVR